jgi:asparagine N-glycosylation enzyme membrane subunit Stt3
VAVSVRALPWPVVITPGGVLPISYDAFYHLRRIWYMVVRFPEFLSVDPYINFPYGGEPIWSPTFDWLLGVLARASVQDGNKAAVEHLLVWVPPVLGGLTVVSLFFLARRYFPSWVAFAAASILCVLPAHFWYSQLGFVDHHVAVALVTTWLLAAAMAFFTGAGARRGAALGVALAASILVWPGCLIHAGIVEAGLVVLCLSRPSREVATRFAAYASAAHLLATVLVLPLCAGNTWIRWGSASPLVLSNFQPLWLGAAAVCFGMLAGLWRFVWFPTSLTDRLLMGGAVGGGLAGIALLALPGLEGLGGHAWSWLGREEEFQSVVAESRPLLWRKGSFAPALGERFLTRAIYLAPPMLAALAWAAKRRAVPELGLLTWWTAALLATTLAQGRFMNSFSVAFCLLIAASLGMAWEWAGPWLRAGRTRIALATLVGAGLSLWILEPSTRAYTTHLDNAARLLRGDPPTTGSGRSQRELSIEVATWLRENTPPTSGYLDVSQSPEYAVLAPWGLGHVIKYVAERPVIQDNFGDDVGAEGFAAAEDYFAAESESEALEIAERLGIRYVVVTQAGSGHSQGYSMQAMWRRLRAPDAAASLRSHRPIFRSAPLAGRRGDQPWLRVYEIVPR